MAYTIKIPHEEFIREWEAAETIDDLANKYEVSKAYCRARARLLRDLGYNLKTFNKSRKPYVVNREG